MANANKRTDAEKQNDSEYPQFHSLTQNPCMLARASLKAKCDGYFVHLSTFLFGLGNLLWGSCQN